MKLSNDASTRECIIRVIDDLEGFLGLKQAWDGLLSGDSPYSPFLCHDWFALWLKYFFREDGRLLILLMYKEGRLVGIAPLMLKTEKYKGLKRTRKVELIGNVHSPVRTIILDQLTTGSIEACLRQVVSFFLTTYKNWDILELEALPEESKAVGIFNDTVMTFGLKKREYVCFGNWFKSGVDYTFDEYFETLPKSLKKDVQYCRRRLQKEGDLKCQIIKDVDGLDHWLALYDLVREKSWKAPEKDKEYVRDFMKLAAERTWLRLGLLFFNGTPIASQKWLVHNNTAHIVDVLYDESFAKYSPGKILTAEMMQHVIDIDRVKEIDFMQGDDAYKSDWTPQRRERKGLMVFNSTLRGSLLGLAFNKVLPAIERHKILLDIKNNLMTLMKNSGQKSRLIN